MATAVTPSPSSEFRFWVEKQSRQNISHCYQCGKCTAGCPAAYTMDMGPRQIMRALQLGLKEEALASSTIWLCVFCQTCSARCPQEIDIARVMESLRLLAVAEKTEPAVKDVDLFHKTFLNVVKRHGRAHELELGARFNLGSRHLFRNMALLPGMLTKGKMPILPSKVKGKSEIRKFFAKVEEREEKG